MKGGFCEPFSESILIPNKIRYGTEHASGLTCGNSSEITQGMNLSTLICNLLFVGRVHIVLLCSSSPSLLQNPMGDKIRKIRKLAWY